MKSFPPIEVDVITIAEYLAHVPATAGAILIKCDTQGNDLEVVRGIRTSIDRVAALQVELSLQALYKNTVHWTVAIDNIERLGFQTAGSFPVTCDPGLLSLVEVDAVFVRDH